MRVAHSAESSREFSAEPVGRRTHGLIALEDAIPIIRREVTCIASRGSGSPIERAISHSSCSTRVTPTMIGMASSSAIRPWVRRPTGSQRIAREDSGRVATALKPAKFLGSTVLPVWNQLRCVTVGLGSSESFIHDVTSTDKRNPTLYANGKVYGADRTGGGRLWVLDPVKNTVEGLQYNRETQKASAPK